MTPDRKPAPTSPGNALIMLRLDCVHRWEKKNAVVKLSRDRDGQFDRVHGLALPSATALLNTECEINRHDLGEAETIRPARCPGGARSYQNRVGWGDSDAKREKAAQIIHLCQVSSRRTMRWRHRWERCCCRTQTHGRGRWRPNVLSRREV